MVMEALAEAEDTFMDGQRLGVRDDLDSDEENDLNRASLKNGADAAAASQSYDLTLGEN